MATGRGASLTTIKRNRFPAEIISHGVGGIFASASAIAMLKNCLFARGIIVTYEAVRKWCRKFGQPYADQLRCRRPQSGDTWQLDGVFLTIHGERYSLWRAVDKDGDVLDMLVHCRRDKMAAKKFFRRLLKGLADVLPGDHHRQTEELRGRQARAIAGCGTPPASLFQ
jgi:putative transposase